MIAVFRDLVVRSSIVTRTLIALAVAALVGTGAATTAVWVMSATHFNCSWTIGGEAGAGTWLCGDGITYLVPVITVAGAAGACTLLLFVAIESQIWRGRSGRWGRSAPASGDSLTPPCG